MLHKIALALFVVFVVVSQAATAGAVKLALTPTDSTSSASGTLHITNGKPSDDACRFRLVVTGLKPNTGYLLDVYGPDGKKIWSLSGIVTDEKGSCTSSGAPPVSQLISATDATLEEESPQIVVMVGKSQ